MPLRRAPIKTGINAKGDQAPPFPQANGPLPDQSKGFRKDEFHGSTVHKDPQEFIAEVYKIVDIMGVTSKERVELAAYQLKGSAQVWYNQWKSERVDEGSIGWEAFKLAFLDRFFPLELREAKVLEFINLKQGNIGKRDYALNFTKQSKCAASLVADPRARMS
ncbi:uncharacterized protein LOC129883538 [Solanum dulcamara]|uniref:uncharacterized protein LOC129883538 n=1 Tax=Solanum dulcamara TaxID=45834 RepID=UPI002485668A|nr:uncharacterized protein LOC129883538 [Solanum dulcamara]